MVLPDELENWESETLRSALSPSKLFEISLKNRVELAFAAGIATGKKNAVRMVAAFTTLSLSIGVGLGLVFGFEMKQISSESKIPVLVHSDHIPEVSRIWTISTESYWLEAPAKFDGFKDLVEGREWTIGFAIKNFESMIGEGK